MKFSHVSALLVTVSLVAACNRKAPTHPNYDNAINRYYEARPACLWSNEKKFPVQSAPKDAKTEGYDALVDAGLLTRTSTEKRIVIVSKRENNYDISSDGRNAWTADPSQPGYGNFCYGHRTVVSIDSATPASNQTGASTTVNYHYVIAGLPPWATAAETQTAFPQIQAALNTPVADTAMLTDTGHGWQVVPPPGSANSGPATAADGKIAQ